MKTLLMCLCLSGCAYGSAAEPSDAATETQPADVSMCDLDSGFSIYCNQFTPNDQAWSWMDVDGGFHLCNDQAVCPTGTACVSVESVGQTQDTLMGSCR